MDGRKIDQHRIIVDRELGRTKKSWLPRRLGGGKGEARRDRRDEQVVRDIKRQLEGEEKDNEEGAATVTAAVEEEPKVEP